MSERGELCDVLGRAHVPHTWPHAHHVGGPDGLSQRLPNWREKAVTSTSNKGCGVQVDVQVPTPRTAVSPRDHNTVHGSHAFPGGHGRPPGKFWYIYQGWLVSSSATVEWSWSHNQGKWEIINNVEINIIQGPTKEITREMVKYAERQERTMDANFERQVSPHKKFVTTCSLVTGIMLQYTQTPNRVVHLKWTRHINRTN